MKIVVLAKLQLTVPDQSGGRFACLRRSSLDFGGIIKTLTIKWFHVRIADLPSLPGTNLGISRRVSSRLSMSDGRRRTRHDRRIRLDHPRTRHRRHGLRAVWPH